MQAFPSSNWPIQYTMESEAKKSVAAFKKWGYQVPESLMVKMWERSCESITSHDFTLWNKCVLTVQRPFYMLWIFTPPIGYLVPPATRQATVLLDHANSQWHFAILARVRVLLWWLLIKVWHWQKLLKLRHDKIGWTLQQADSPNTTINTKWAINTMAKNFLQISTLRPASTFHLFLCDIHIHHPVAHVQFCLVLSFPLRAMFLQVPIPRKRSNKSDQFLPDPETGKQLWGPKSTECSLNRYTPGDNMPGKYTVFHEW